jgi:hypothetical protein
MNWTEILNVWGPFGVVLVFVALLALRVYADFKPHFLDRLQRTSRLIETLRRNDSKKTRAQLSTAESLQRLTLLSEAQSAKIDLIYKSTVNGRDTNDDPKSPNVGENAS